VTLFPPQNKLTFAPPPPPKPLCKFCTGFLFLFIFGRGCVAKIREENTHGSGPQNAHQRKNDPAPKFFFRKASSFALCWVLSAHTVVHTSLATNKDGASQQRQRERERGPGRERERERALVSTRGPARARLSSTLSFPFFWLLRVSERRHVGGEKKSQQCRRLSLCK